MRAPDLVSEQSKTESTYVFVAFPEKPQWTYECINTSIEKANELTARFVFHGWPANDIPGRPLTAPIRSGICDAVFVVADITVANTNVTYEIGFAIGAKKRVFLTRNSTLNERDSPFSKVGIFDTLGYQTYNDSTSLAQLLASVSDLTPLEVGQPLDRRAPIYLVESPHRGESMGHIVSSVKKARLQYRSFNPSEDTRLSAIDAITHVASSHGIVVPLVSNDMHEGPIHNIRAAFVAGLAHGMDKPTLILQPFGIEAPLDLRDFAKEYSRLEDIKRAVHDFALDVMESIQLSEPIVLPGDRALARLSIGDPMAENEFQTLAKYYLRREEFDRTVRGEVNLVVGRKGSGKTALFSQVRDYLRRDRDVVVLDLKPEGFQLIKLRQHVVDFLEAGAKEHLVTAFWEYLLLREVAQKLIEKDRQRHLWDHLLLPHYDHLRAAYAKSAYVGEGDFSERLADLSESVVDEYQSQFGPDERQRLTADQVTEIIHSNSLRELRQRISKYLEFKKGVWILFDNLDKGWSIPGPSQADILMLRCLIDGARKCQRDMQQDGHNFHSVIFIRNDVYQLLMKESPDFGKEMRVSLDWNDPDMLREMLRLRLIQNDLPSEAEFDLVWTSICVSHYRAEETSQYMIDRCLMRPRNLLKLFNHCKGFAANLRHDKIEAEDIEKGIRSYSDDLLVEADQELASIEPAARDLIYYFIGEDYVFSHEEIQMIFEDHDIPDERYEEVIRFLLYFGFFGLRVGSQTTYIFDVGYDMKRLDVPISKNLALVRYVLNPAFWPALGVGPDAQKESALTA